MVELRAGNIIIEVVDHPIRECIKWLQKVKRKQKQQAIEKTN